MFNGFVSVILISYVLLCVAFLIPKKRRFHISIMIANIVLDIGVPFYLFIYRDWKAHLIDNGDILSFGVWMHFGLVITLYVLYVFQVQTGRLMLKNQEVARDGHAGQGKAIVGVRGLVILTGILVFDTEVASEAHTNL